MPKARRRRGDTDRGFARAAKETVRRSKRLPSEAYAAAAAFLSSTLDWLTLWHDDAAHVGMHDSGMATQKNPLSPRL